MASEKFYKSFFGMSVVINAFVSILFLLILIWSSVQKQYLPVSVAISCIIFVALFVLFIGVLLMMKRRSSDVLVMWAVVLSIGRLLAVLIGAFAMLSSDTFKQDDRAIEEDVVSWLEYRKLVVIAFCVLYFPLFLIELFVLNRYHTWELKVDTNSKKPLEVAEATKMVPPPAQNV